MLIGAEPSQQRRLADTRLAGHGHEATATGARDVPERLRECGSRVVTFEQRVAHIVEGGLDHGCGSLASDGGEDLLQTGRLELIQTLWAVEVLQPVLAEVAEMRAGELGVLEHGRRRERDEHLPTVGRRHDASGAMHAEAVVALVGRARLGGVYAHPDTYVARFRPLVRREGALRVDRRLRGLVRTPEGKEERVALVVDLLARVILRRRPKDSPMLGQELAVPCTQPLQELRRSLYVSEEEGDGSRGESRRAHRMNFL